MANVTEQLTEDLPSQNVALDQDGVNSWDSNVSEEISEVYTYQRSDGTIEVASSILDARERCPFLGSLPLSEVKAMLELSLMGQEIMTNKAILKESQNKIVKNKESIESSLNTNHQALPKKPENNLSNRTNETEVLVSNTQEQVLLKTNPNQQFRPEPPKKDSLVIGLDSINNKVKKSTSQPKPIIKKSIATNKKINKTQITGIGTVDQSNNLPNDKSRQEENKTNKSDDLVNLSQEDTPPQEFKKNSNFVIDSLILPNKNILDPQTTLEINDNQESLSGDNIKPTVAETNISDFYQANFIKTLYSMVEDFLTQDLDQNDLDNQEEADVSLIDNQREKPDQIARVFRELYEKIVAIDESIVKDISSTITKIISLTEGQDLNESGQDNKFIISKLKDYTLELFKILDIDCSNKELNIIVGLFKTSFKIKWQEQKRFILDLEHVGTREAKYGFTKTINPIKDRTIELSQLIGKFTLFCLSVSKRLAKPS
ncbi:MAG: hypothetical protein M1554_02270 [Patescibacteria group bacterium]|jgi:hypothetical protein|nr:hypothetical protein [Patescibacteria group bacterium]